MLRNVDYKIYILNLEKAKEKLDFMSSQLEKMDLSFERINGIWGEDYFGNEYNSVLALEKNGKKMVPGEIGCALSHKKAIEKFMEDLQKDKNLKYGLILEDDVLLNKNFKNILETTIMENEKYFLKNKSYFWEYLQFDYVEPFYFWTQAWWKQVFQTFREKKKCFQKMLFIFKSILKLPVVFCYALFEIIRNKIFIGPVRFYRDIYLAGAYLINKEGVEKLLSLSREIIYPADKLQNEAKRLLGLKIKYYCPTISFQQRNDFESEVVVHYNKIAKIHV